MQIKYRIAGNNFWASELSALSNEYSVASEPLNPLQRAIHSER